jgi:hypothetical protein
MVDCRPDGWGDEGETNMMAVGLGLMIAMMAGMFAGGALFMHHEEGHKNEEHTIIQKDHDHDKVIEYPSKIMPVDQGPNEPGP